MCSGDLLKITTLCDACHRVAWPPLHAILDILFPKVPKYKKNPKFANYPCKITTKEVSFECSHYRIVPPHSKVRTTCTLHVSIKVREE